MGHPAKKSELSQILSKASGFEGGDLIDQTVRDTPLERIGYPDDIATVVAFLASDDARWPSAGVF